MLSLDFSIFSTTFWAGPNFDWTAEHTEGSFQAAGIWYWTDLILFTFPLGKSGMQSNWGRSCLTLLELPVLEASRVTVKRVGHIHRHKIKRKKRKRRSNSRKEESKWHSCFPDVKSLIFFFFQTSSAVRLLN